MTNEKKVYNDLGTFVSVERIERAGKPYFTISFSPTSGPMAGKTMQRGGFASALKNSMDTIKSLREGDDVTLLVTLNKVGDKTYRNLVGVETGHIKQASAPKKSSTSKSQGTNTGEGKKDNSAYVEGMRRGNAFSNAYATALKHGYENDSSAVLAKALELYHMHEVFQKAEDIEIFATAVTVTPVTTPQATPQVAPQASKTENIVEEIGMDDDIFADLDL